jgi:hypothetical protein
MMASPWPRPTTSRRERGSDGCARTRSDREFSRVETAPWLRIGQAPMTSCRSVNGKSTMTGGRSDGNRETPGHSLFRSVGPAWGARPMVTGITVAICVLVGVLAFPLTGKASDTIPRRGAAESGRVRIQIRPTIVRAGSSVRFRTENGTADNLINSWVYSVQVYIGESWQRADFSPLGPWPDSRRQIRPGRWSLWEEVPIPSDVMPGLYHIKKGIDVRGRQRWITRSFEVVADGRGALPSAGDLITPPNGPSTQEEDGPLSWKFKSVLGRHSIEISVGWSSCAGGPPAVRPQVSQGRGRAVITIHRIPATEAPGPCLKSRGVHLMRIRLAGAVADLQIYDGSSSPPALRFPVPGDGGRRVKRLEDGEILDKVPRVRS